MKLTPQEKKVYDFIRDNPGCTTHDITMATYIQKPCARLVGIQRKGVEIAIVGEKRYPGSRPFKQYAIGKPLTKMKTIVEVIDNIAYKREIEVNV